MGAIKLDGIGRTDLYRARFTGTEGVVNWGWGDCPTCLQPFKSVVSFTHEKSNRKKEKSTARVPSGMSDDS